MDRITTAQIRELASRHDGRHVSIYLPTHPASPEGQQDAPRLKNLLVQAQTLLVEKGMRAPEARELLQPVEDLLENGRLWKARSQGLAIFVGADFLRYYRLPLQLEEAVYVDRCFHVKQLLPLLTAQGQVYVLTLSRNQVRLLAATRDGYEPVELRGLPKNMEDALNLQGADRGEQVHAATSARLGAKQRKEAAVFHGQGGHSDTLKDEIEQYFRVIDSALHQLVSEPPAALLIGGVEYELPIFRKVCTYPRLAESQLTGNFDHASDHEVYQQALPLVREILDQPRREAAALYADLTDTPKTSDDLRSVLIAAQRGRVDTLLVDYRSEVLGHFDGETEHLDRRPARDADDLIELAAVSTLDNGGTVYALEREDMPCANPVAAILRY